MQAFFGKFSPVSRDLEIFTVPRIVGRMRESRMIFIPSAFRAQSAHNLIRHDGSIVTERFSTFNQEDDQLSFILALDIIEQARS